MATPNVVPFLSSTGASTTGDLTLARTIYANDFWEAFRKRARFLDMMPFVDKRSMLGSKQFQFYMFGETTELEKEYVDGDELTGTDYAVDTGTVNVDDQIVAHKVVGLKDSMVSHVGVIPYLARENARVTALEIDRRLLNQHIAAARTAAATKNGQTIHNGGIRTYRSGGSTTLATALAAAYPLSATGASNLIEDLNEQAYNADVEYWPEEGRGMILDAYLRRVLQFDTTGKVHTVDYKAPNDVTSRKYTEIAGWRLQFWDTRVSQGGLLPDSNIGTYVRSTKFNIDCSVGATNGYPIGLFFCGGGEDTASVGMGTWLGMTDHIDYNERNHTTLAQTYCLLGIEKMRPWCAGTLELRSA